MKTLLRHLLEIRFNLYENAFAFFTSAFVARSLARSLGSSQQDTHAKDSFL
jgi:hypothetical protein